MARVKISNPYLNSNEVDFLSHFGITCTEDVRKEFEDVKFVCMSGSSMRIKMYAETFHNETGVDLSENLCKTDRYAMYKTGPVLWVNHGMGTPSLSIMLNELIKLLYYAQATDVIFIRVAISYGVGVEPGTVIVSSGTLNGLLEPVHIQQVMGEVIKLDAKLDEDLCKELYEMALILDIPVEKGLTLSTDDFFEGIEIDPKVLQLFCFFTPYMEMEGTCLAALTRKAGIRSAIVSATFLDRLNEDLERMDLSPDCFHDFEMRPFKVVSALLVKKLKL